MRTNQKLSRTPSEKRRNFQSSQKTVSFTPKTATQQIPSLQTKGSSTSASTASTSKTSRTTSFKNESRPLTATTDISKSAQKPSGPSTAAMTASGTPSSWPMTTSTPLTAIAQPASTCLADLAEKTTWVPSPSGTTSMRSPRGVTSSSLTRTPAITAPWGVYLTRRRSSRPLTPTSTPSLPAQLREISPSMISESPSFPNSAQRSWTVCVSRIWSSRRIISVLWLGVRAIIWWVLIWGGCRMIWRRRWCLSMRWRMKITFRRFSSVLQDNFTQEEDTETVSSKPGTSTPRLSSPPSE